MVKAGSVLDPQGRPLTWRRIMRAAIVEFVTMGEMEDAA
jgi:hypothetical protein